MPDAMTTASMAIPKAGLMEPPPFCVKRRRSGASIRYRGSVTGLLRRPRVASRTSRLGSLPDSFHHIRAARHGRRLGTRHQRISGWAIFLSNVLAFLFLPVYVLYLNRFQIAPEERVLTSLFGETYVAYQARARRWL